MELLLRQDATRTHCITCGVNSASMLCIQITDAKHCQGMCGVVYQHMEHKKGKQHQTLQVHSSNSPRYAMSNDLKHAMVWCPVGQIAAPNTAAAAMKMVNVGAYNSDPNFDTDSWW